MTNQATDPIKDRLESDFEKARILEARSSFIIIESTQGTPPTFYVIRLLCRGIRSISNSSIEYSENHLFEFNLAPPYPFKKPVITCKTPIVHPNISSSGQTCIGNEWTSSGRFLDDLIIYVAQMVRYEGFDLTVTVNAFNRSAYDWAKANRHILPIDKRPLLDKTGVVVLNSRRTNQPNNPSGGVVKVISKR